MRSLATRDTGSEISAALPDVLAAVQGRRLRPRDRRDLGHRPGRRGDRAAGRRADVRDDARVRRREPAREDRHARLRRVRRDQQVRPQGRGRRAARRRQAGAAQPRGLRQAGPTRCRCSAPWPAASTTTASPRCTRRCSRGWPSSGLTLADGRLPRGRHAPQHAPGARSCPARACATWPRSPTRVRGYKRRAREQAALAREIQQLRAAARMLQAGKPDTRAAPPKRVDRPRASSARRGSTPHAKKLLAQWPDDAEGLRRRRVRREDPRQGDPHRADPHHAVGQQDPQGRAAAATRTTASC